MSWIEIILLVIGALVVGFLLMAWLGTRSSKKAGAEGAVLLKGLEDKYDSFMRSHLNLSLIGEGTEPQNEDQLVEEAMEYLEPDILGLIAHINATPYSLARTEYPARLLTNIPNVVNDLYEKSRRTGDEKLSENHEKQLRTAFETAIRSHVKKRLLDIETGKALENL